MGPWGEGDLLTFRLDQVWCLPEAWWLPAL